MSTGILINQEVVGRFARLLKSGRMAHAYLFSGPAELGKSETALAVAKLVNCEQRIAGTTEVSCEQCSSCLKINSGNHPDIFIIKREEDSETVKIAQIRELISRLQMRAFEAAKKICIIKNIEFLTDDASNSLLKTLEEPAKDTLIFLTTAVPEENLKTIVSRCHQVKFYPLSAQQVAKQLIQEDGLDPASANCLAQFSEGCLGKARQLHEEDFFRRKNEMIDNLIFHENNEPYLKKLLGDKVETKEALTVLLSWLRDLIILKAGGGQKQLVHNDRYDELLKLERNYSFDKINGIIEEIVQTLNMLGENLNIKIPFILLREKIWAG